MTRLQRRENGPTGEKPEDERPKPGTVDQKISLFASSADAEKRQQHEQVNHRQQFLAPLIIKHVPTRSSNNFVFYLSSSL